MATSTMLNVGENFDLYAFAQQLSEAYQQKGFTVQVANMGNGVSIIFDKNTGGINMLLGLGLGITANCVVNNGTLIINYTNAEWTGKIIGLAVGWLLCLIPFITAIIGCIKQSSLPKEIGNDAMMIASNLMSGPYEAAPGYYGDQAPTYQPGPTYQQAPYYQQTPTYEQPSAYQQAPTYQQAPPYQQPMQMGAVDNANAWNCSCGKTGNIGAFCSNCGSPRPQ